MKDIALRNGDIYVANGSIQTVEKSDKLNQQLRKILLTTIGNYLHPNYGSNILSLLGEGQGDDTSSDIKASIRNAMDYFVSLQEGGIQLDLYDAEEVLYKVLSITVETPDPRAAFPVIEIMSAAQENIEFQLIF